MGGSQSWTGNINRSSLDQDFPNQSVSSFHTASKMTLASRIVRHLAGPLIRAAIMKGMLRPARLRSFKGNVCGKVKVSEQG